VRQPGQPFADEPVDLLVSQPIADPLRRVRITGRAERVVQGGKADPGLEAMPLGIFMPVYLLTELRGVSSQFRGQVPVRVATVPAHDRIRGTVTESGGAGGASARFAGGDRVLAREADQQFRRVNRHLYLPAFRTALEATSPSMSPP